MVHDVRFDGEVPPACCVRRGPWRGGRLNGPVLPTGPPRDGELDASPEALSRHGWGGVLSTVPQSAEFVRYCRVENCAWKSTRMPKRVCKPIQINGLSSSGSVRSGARRPACRGGRRSRPAPAEWAWAPWYHRAEAGLAPAARLARGRWQPGRLAACDDRALEAPASREEALAVGVGSWQTWQRLRCRLAPVGRMFCPGSGFLVGTFPCSGRAQRCRSACCPDRGRSRNAGISSGA